MYLWLTLSAEQGNLMARHDLPMLTQEALPKDIADGVQLLAQYRSRHSASKSASPSAGGGTAQGK